MCVWGGDSAPHANCSSGTVYAHIDFLFENSNKSDLTFDSHMPLILQQSAKIEREGKMLTITLHMKSEIKEGGGVKSSSTPAPESEAEETCSRSRILYNTSHSSTRSLPASPLRESLG